jgi:hypothetical protein
VKVLTDCAVCHVPERPPRSLFKLLSDAALTLEIEFDPSVPERERGPWRERLLQKLSDSDVTVREAPAPNAAPVSVRVRVEAGPGRTDRGLGFFAARATATVRLHRASVTETSRPGVATDEAGAIRKALDDLAQRVLLVLTW